MRDDQAPPARPSWRPGARTTVAAIASASFLAVLLLAHLGALRLPFDVPGVYSRNPSLGAPDPNPSRIPYLVPAPGSSTDPVAEFYSDAPTDYPMSEEQAFLVGGMEKARSAQFAALQLALRDGVNVSILRNGSRDRNEFAYLLPYMTPKAQEKYTTTVNAALSGDTRAQSLLKSLAPYNVAPDGTVYAVTDQNYLSTVSVTQPQGSLDQATAATRIVMSLTVTALLTVTDDRTGRLLEVNMLRDVSFTLVPAQSGYTVSGSKVLWLIDDWAGSVSYGDRMPVPGGG